MLARYLPEPLRRWWLRAKEVEETLGVLAWLSAIGAAAVTGVMWLFGGSDAAAGVAAIIVSFVAAFFGVHLYGWSRGHPPQLIPFRQLTAPRQETGQLSLDLTARREELDELEYFAKRYLDPLQDRLRTASSRLTFPDTQDAPTVMLCRIAEEYVSSQFWLARTQFYHIMSLDDTNVTYHYLARYICEYKIATGYP